MGNGESYDESSLSLLAGSSFETGVDPYSVNVLGINGAMKKKLEKA